MVYGYCRVIFNGNGYAEEWIEEAVRRGLPNITNMVDAVGYLTWDKSIELFEKHHVLTRVELASREEVGYESYSKAINIEARTMLDMARKEIIPAVIRYTTDLAKSVHTVKSVGADASLQESELNKCSVLLSELGRAVDKLEAAVNRAAAIEDPKTQALSYRDEVFRVMSDVRNPADALELLVDEALWPFPTYGELLFNVTG